MHNNKVNFNGGQEGFRSCLLQICIPDARLYIGYFHLEIFVRTGKPQNVRQHTIGNETDSLEKSIDDFLSNPGRDAQRNQYEQRQ